MRKRSLFGWCLIRIAKLEDLQDESDRRRRRNEQSAIDILERDTAVDACRTMLADTRAELSQSSALCVEAGKRADTASAIVRGQAAHIEQLQRANDRMLTAITDMRRTGYALPSDVLKEPVNDEITTVADDDLQAMKDYPHLVAGDED